jgi:hypothetical protein
VAAARHIGAVDYKAGLPAAGETGEPDLAG